MSAQSGTIQPQGYSYAIHSGGAEVAILIGQEAVGPEWTDFTISSDTIDEALLGGVQDVKFQINAPSSGPRLKVTRVRMLVEYDASSPNSQ